MATKHPKTEATPGGVAKGPSNRKSRYPSGDAGELFLLMDDAAKAVLSDLVVWNEEAARSDAAPLPWPLEDVEDAKDARGYDQFLRNLMANSVDEILTMFARTGGGLQPPPPDPSRAEFQVVLRIAKRMTEAADQAAKARFSGTGRISIKRVFDKWMAERAVDAAIQDGGNRDAAFRSAGLSRSAAYRAMRRLHNK